MSGYRKKCNMRRGSSLFLVAILVYSTARLPLSGSLICPSSCTLSLLRNEFWGDSLMVQSSSTEERHKQKWRASTLACWTQYLRQSVYRTMPPRAEWLPSFSESHSYRSVFFPICPFSSRKTGKTGKNCVQDRFAYSSFRKLQGEHQESKQK